MNVFFFEAGDKCSSKAKNPASFQYNMFAGDDNVIRGLISNVLYAGGI